MEYQLQKIVKGISKLLDNRFELLMVNNCKNILDYNKRFHVNSNCYEILPDLRLQIDFPASQFEIPDVEPELVETMDMINRINLLGRAVGIEILIENSKKI